MNELSVECPIDEFCVNYMDADEEKLNYAAERLDIIVGHNDFRVSIFDCMRKNCSAETRENCPMVAIFLKRAELTGRTEMPGMKFLRGNTI